MGISCLLPSGIRKTPHPTELYDEKCHANGYAPGYDATTINH